MTLREGNGALGQIEQASEDRPRLMHGIQVLRAVAALLVALFHGHLAFAGAGADTYFAAESYVLAFGAVGVHIFFVISGFIMVHTSSFAGGFSARQFLRRRLMRIYPIYWICVALYLLAHAAIAQPYDLTPGQLAGALLLAPGHAARIIGPAWTLAFEMYFYLCFGLFMTLGLNRGLLALGGFFLAMIALHPLLPWRGAAINLAGSTLLLEFLAGCAIGWLSRTGRLPGSGGTVLIGLALALFAAGLMLGYDRYPSVVVWGVPSALLVGGLVMVENGRRAGPATVRLGRLGESSYALYLVHILVITLVLTAAGDRADSIPALGAALAIAILAQIVAEALHRGVEKPLLRRLNRRGGPGSGRLPAPPAAGHPAE